MFGNRTWITRSEIADIHVQIANLALSAEDTDHAVDPLNMSNESRDIDKVGRGLPR